MKTSLSHLPKTTQEQILQIVETIREVVNPQMVILFGSYAKGKQVIHKYTGRDGTFNEYISDYDFLIVVDKVTEDTSAHEWTIEERTEKYGSPVNLEIHEVSFINKGLETGQYFFTDIIKEGIILFDTGIVKFADPRELTPTEQKERAEEYFNNWFLQANEFIIDGLNAYNRRSFKKAVFELHQATESLYYTVLLVFTSYKPKTHNLKRLRKKAKHLSEELFFLFPVEANKNEKQLFELLKQGYINARYKSNYVVSEKEVSEILDRIQNMKVIVDQICKEKIFSLS